MDRYAIIDGINVVNVIDYLSPPGNPPPGFPANYIAVQSDTAGPGWTYEDGIFTAPPPPPVPPMTIEDVICQAEGLLVSSDWSILPDVKLSNAADWVSYRAALRAIRLNPTLDPAWPVCPPADWA